MYYQDFNMNLCLIDMYPQFSDSFVLPYTKQLCIYYKYSDIKTPTILILTAFPRVTTRLLLSWLAYIANNMDPDQTAPLEQSDQGSHCLLP